MIRAIPLALPLLLLALVRPSAGQEVDPSQLAKKGYLAVGVSVDAPPEMIKAAKMSVENVKAQTEKILKDKKLRVVDSDNERLDMIMKVTLGMKPEAGGILGTCEVNVIVVVVNFDDDTKKLKIAWDNFTKLPGRTPGQVGNLIGKQLIKDLGDFAAEYHKRNRQ